MLSTETIKNFHKNRGQINRIVKKQVKDNKSILTGGHALNTYLPPFLKRHTEDFDIFSKQPKKSANQLEKRLDDKFNSDLFFVQPALHKDTYKVMNRVTEKEVADFTKTPEKININKKDNINIASLGFLKSKFNESLNDSNSAYRHSKDRDALRRLRAVKK